ncbi:hypothetical protein OfM1_02940 [Lactovum odontotermitis]
MKKLNLKNKILVAAVSLAAIGSTGFQIANVVNADAPTPRVWIGQVRDERWMNIANNHVVYDRTTYKDLRCPNGYKEIQPYHRVTYEGMTEKNYWKFYYNVF